MKAVNPRPGTNSARKSAAMLAAPLAALALLGAAPASAVTITAPDVVSAGDHFTYVISSEQDEFPFMLDVLLGFNPLAFEIVNFQTNPLLGAYASEIAPEDIEFSYGAGWSFGIATYFDDEFAEATSLVTLTLRALPGFTGDAVLSSFAGLTGRFDYYSEFTAQTSLSVAAVPVPAAGLLLGSLLLGGVGVGALRRRRDSNVQA